MDVRASINQKAKVFIQLCQLHKVDKLYVFGSSLTDRFDKENSDIDILVELNITEPVERGEMLLSLWDELEIFFNRKVDLLTEAQIKNPYLKSSIDRTKQIVYDRAGEKILI